MILIRAQLILVGKLNKISKGVSKTGLCYVEQVVTVHIVSIGVSTTRKRREEIFIGETRWFSLLECLQVWKR